jgi:hypothetical protein
VVDRRQFLTIDAPFRRGSLPLGRDFYAFASTVAPTDVAYGFSPVARSCCRSPSASFLTGAWLVLVVAGRAGAGVRSESARADALADAMLAEG